MAYSSLDTDGWSDLSIRTMVADILSSPVPKEITT